ncbi:MAG: substrate-binding domain-containing protein [Polyangiaceae bacterium]
MTTSPRSPPPAPAELLKSAEVARLLRVHPKQIYRLLAQGLPGRRVGSEWRFVREEVLAWIEDRERGASTPATERASAVSPAAPAHAGVPTAGSLPPTLQPMLPAIPATGFRAPPPLLAANGDVVVEVLLSQVQAHAGRLLGLVQADSGAAFQQLVAGGVLAAGFHGQPPPSHIAAVRLARVHLVRRDVGLAHPRAIRLQDVTDLVRKRLAIRAPSAGVRAHLDRALAEAGVTLAGMHTVTVTVDSHRDASCAVVRGEVDAALTTSAWAARMGLDFLRLASEPYDLVLRAESLGLPDVVALCEVAQSQAFRDALSAIPGYDPSAAGEIRYDPPSP